MNKSQVIAKIQALLDSWTNDPEASNDTEAVFEQMIFTFAELEDGAEITFEDLVRFAAHDVYRYQNP
jgi:hypothetical protein